MGGRTISVSDYQMTSQYQLGGAGSLLSGDKHFIITASAAGLLTQVPGHTHITHYGLWMTLNQPCDGGMHQQMHQEIAEDCRAQSLSF